MPSLFDPIQFGAISAPNRILMAPLTRTRSSRDHVPTPLMAEYYAQRASAGLIISEAIGISREGLGTAFAPGIWTDEQTQAWKPITAAVHAAGGRILAQLWHMGRIVHSDFLGGAQPVSASATTAPGNVRTYDGKKPYVAARPLGLDEIPRLIEDYRHAARNALAAGFDGVQLHSANGYLLDQFLRDSSNFRDDAYGGAIANRIRLTTEVTAALVEVAGAGRVSVRLSPNGDSQGVNDSDPEPLFAAVAAALSALDIAFLEVREPRPGGSYGASDRDPIAPTIRAAFAGPLVLNSDYRGDSAQAALDSGETDAVSFGRTFIANPDLPARLRDGLPLTPDNMATWYTPGPAGYTDYPVHENEAA